MDYFATKFLSLSEYDVPYFDQEVNNMSADDLVTR